MVRLGANLWSRARFVADVWMSRVLFLPGLTSGAKRNVVCGNGTSLVYRLNRGDLQSIREVLCDGAYRLPFEVRPTTLVDLGANIGLTSVWIHTTYGCERVVAVEPDPANAEIAKENFRSNNVPGDVVVAAIGPTDGVASFIVNRVHSNMGSIIDQGKEYTPITPELRFA